MSTGENKVAKAEGKKLNLPSGKVAEIKPFKGRHVREAQKIAGDDQSMIVFAMIAITTTVDGNPVVAEDLDEMDGADVLALMGEFSGNL